MSEPSPIPDDERIERLLDHLPASPEREAAAIKLRAEGGGDAVALHDEIESALRRRFPVVAASPQQVDDFAAMLRKGGAVSRWPVWSIAGAAAAVLLLAFAWGQRRSESLTPFFEPTPLVALYKEAVLQGFEPYYECEDPARFAAVFAKRQDLALELKPMPPGSRMLGLSYPGGLSRDTTAMLCSVDDQPVMVFVDRMASDRLPEAITAAGDGLQVFRSTLAGLVLYEVTPLQEPRAAPFLVVTPSR